MNILIYTTKSTYISCKVGGAETSLRLIAEKLAERGHNVFFITYNYNNFWRNKKKNIKGVNVILFSSRNGFILSKIIYKIFPNFKNKILKYRFKCLLKNILEENEIQALYMYYELEPLKVFLELRSKINYVIIMRMAGLYWYEQIKKFQNFKKDYEYVFNSVDSINYISKGLYKLTTSMFHEVSLKLNNNEYFVGDIGVEGINVNQIWRKQSKENSLKILVATRFSSHQKRQDVLIEAARIIKNKFPIQITMIGDGQERERLTQKVINYGLSNTITIIPFMTQNNLWSIMKNSDILCHPCDYEGLSKIIIESLMIGLPVLASNVLPLSDYIEEKVNGYLVDNSPEEWASKLEYINYNRQDLPRISENARNYVKKYYLADKNILLYESEFDKLINKYQ